MSEAARLAAQAEGCVLGIRSIQRLVEDSAARVPQSWKAGTPLAESAVEVMSVGRLAELRAYASDATEALEALAAQGHPLASVALWDVLRCDPLERRATLASLLSANLNAVLELVAECGRHHAA